MSQTADVAAGEEQPQEPPEVESLLAAVVALHPELDDEARAAVRRTIVMLRQSARALAAFPLANADEPATLLGVPGDG